MATLTRGAVTLTPTLVLPSRLTAPATVAVNRLIGTSDVDLVDVGPALRAGELVTLWASTDEAMAATAALTTAGGPWVVNDGGADVDGTWQVLGGVSVDASFGTAACTLTVSVQEVAS
jgi:hypothetical protein